MWAALATAALCASAAPAPPGFVDPLDVPARPSALAGRAPLVAVTLAGRRLVAVGERGHVLASDDDGATWTQAAVPVSADLTAVRFVSPELGWVAGHDGVLLATRDGGRTWERRLDGRGLGPDASLFDVGFADERLGFAVGAFGLLLRTDDGGTSWAPWRDRAENPRGLHLYGIASAAGAVWIAGEQGLLLRLDRAGRRFGAVRVPYGGSFFGVVGCGGAVLAWGLQGSVLRTTDGGATWRGAATGVEEAITGAAILPDGRLVLVSQGGRLLRSDDCGATFGEPTGGARPASAVAPAGPAAVVVVGPGGVRREALR